jgi:hypothetical protein
VDIFLSFIKHPVPPIEEQPDSFRIGVTATHKRHGVLMLMGHCHAKYAGEEKTPISHRLMGVLVTC